ncbi:MAG: hypothetical protein H6839_03400 [Planctomycetes bacterium]|nr:hypothetical protein [Planctomycetota bacterium]
MFFRPVAALACCALLLLVARNPVTAAPEVPRVVQDTQIMDWVFAMPEGWRVANSRLNSPITKLLALEHTERAEDALTQVTFGRPCAIEGEFRKWFDGHWKQLNKDYTFAEPDEPTETEMPDGYKAVAGAGLTQMEGGKARVVMLIGLNKGAYGGVMCFLTEDLEHFEANVARMDALLASATFASLRGKDEPAPKLRTHIDPDWTPSFTWETAPGWPKGDSPLEGLWGQYAMLTDQLFNWGWTFRPGYYYLLFFKDGTVVTRMPPEGLLSLNPEFLKQEFAANFGTYTVKDDVVTVTTGSADAPYVTTYTRKGGELKKGDAVYRPVKDDKPVLSGRYIYSRWGARDEKYRKSITFNENGSFDDEGFNVLLAARWWCGDAYWLFEQEPEPGKGTWRVEKNTLELIYEDGRKRRYGFHIHEEDGGKTRSLVLNSKLMIRLDK